MYTTFRTRTSQTSFSSAFAPSAIDASTGINVRDRTIDPNRAKITVSAIGRKSFPSVPSSARIGRYTTAMINSPNWAIRLIR